MEYVIRLASGRYYWNPRDRVTPRADRWCHSELAATKFPTTAAAEQQAATEGLEGYSIIEYKA